MWLNQLFGFGLGTWKHGKPDYATLKPAAEMKPIDYPKPDGIISFDRLTNVAFSATNHEEDEPAHLKLKNPAMPIAVNLPNWAEPAQRYCPAGVYEVVERGRQGPALPDQPSELRPLQDLRHQGPLAEHRLGGAARRRGAELSQYVSAADLGWERLR